LTRNLWLCFDGDAAGEAATLRGMELAIEQGFAIRVVTLPAGQDPADLASGFEARLGKAEHYLLYRVRLEIDRAADRQEAFVRVRELLAPVEDSPDRQDAVRLAADRLDLPPDTQAGLATRTRAATGTVSPKLLEKGDRLERDALAGGIANPGVVTLLAELPPEHFDSEAHRQIQAYVTGAADAPAELLPLIAELDARAAAEHIDEATAKELLLRLRERKLRRDLQRSTDDLVRTKELQEALARVQAAVSGLT